MTNAKHMQGVAAGRASTYAVLAALFAAPPSKEMAAMISIGDFLPAGNDAVRAAAQTLVACFRRSALDELPQNDLVAEYTRLFVLPSGVRPNESFYMDPNQRLGGHITVAVQRFYQDAAAHLTGDCLELADHIGVELEFMQFLCDIEAQLWEPCNHEGLNQCLEFQNRFLTAHLLRWHRVLCQKVIEESELELYQALAQFTIDFLETERVFVPELSREICSEGSSVCVP